MVPPCLRLFFIAGEYRRLRAASFFLDGQKETKKPPGGRSDGRFAPIFTVPWTPVYGGRQCGNLAVNAKARVVQSNACPSSFAAAYLAVNRELGTPLFECAFVAVGLKFSSGIRREGQAPPLQVLKKAFLTWVGESLGAPVVNESGTVGSAKPGAAVGPHRRQFLQPQGPVARWEFRPATQILRAESPWKFLRRGPRRMGTGGKPSWRTKFAPAASPGDPLGTFPLCRFTMQVQQ